MPIYTYCFWQVYQKSFSVSPASEANGQSKLGIAWSANCGGGQDHQGGEDFSTIEHEKVNQIN